MGVCAGVNVRAAVGVWRGERASSGGWRGGVERGWGGRGALTEGEIYRLHLGGRGGLGFRLLGARVGLKIVGREVGLIVGVSLELRWIEMPGAGGANVRREDDTVSFHLRLQY